MASLPKDDNNQTIQLTPAVVALARTVSSSLSSTNEITLNTATTSLRIYATSQDVYLKWGTADVTSSNFDEVIPAGQIIDLMVAKDATTKARYTAINLIERAAGASVIVIEK